MNKNLKITLISILSIFLIIILFITIKSINKHESKIKNIVDTTQDIEVFVCLQALEKFYEDENYEYYFSCIMSKYIKVYYKDGTEEDIKSALKNGNIKISDVDRYNINYIKESKKASSSTTSTTTRPTSLTTSTTTTTTTSSVRTTTVSTNRITTAKIKNKIKNIVDKVNEEGLSCLQALEKFYEDENYEYYFSCMKSDLIIVTYENGEEETVKSALETGRISITDLDKYSIRYYSEKK